MAVPSCEAFLGGGEEGDGIQNSISPSKLLGYRCFSLGVVPIRNRCCGGLWSMFIMDRKECKVPREKGMGTRRRGEVYL
jgi:hypothetical protein